MSIQFHSHLHPIVQLQGNGPKPIVLINKFSDSPHVYDLPGHLDPQEYTIATLHFQSTTAENVAHPILILLDEQKWDKAVVVAHTVDYALPQQLTELAPERVAGLFLIDLPQIHSRLQKFTPVPPAHPTPLPTLVVSNRTADTDPALPYGERIDLTGAHGIETPSVAHIAEVLHAFCNLRIAN